MKDNNNNNNNKNLEHLSFNVDNSNMEIECEFFLKILYNDIFNENYKIKHSLFPKTVKKYSRTEENESTFYQGDREVYESISRDIYTIYKIQKKRKLIPKAINKFSNIINPKHIIYLNDKIDLFTEINSDIAKINKTNNTIILDLEDKVVDAYASSISNWSQYTG